MSDRVKGRPTHKGYGRLPVILFHFIVDKEITPLGEPHFAGITFTDFQIPTGELFCPGITKIGGDDNMGFDFPSDQPAENIRRQIGRVDAPGMIDANRQIASAVDYIHRIPYLSFKIVRKGFVP